MTVPSPHRRVLCDAPGKMPVKHGYTLARTHHPRVSTFSFIALLSTPWPRSATNASPPVATPTPPNPSTQSRLLAPCAAWIGNPGGVAAVCRPASSCSRRWLPGSMSGISHAPFPFSG
jgi:hypothetical protein